VTNGLHLVLGWPSVEDAGPEPGWLIFKTPVSELGVHPTDGPPTAELHLMCSDIADTVAGLTAKGVPVAPVSERPYGAVTELTLPSGAKLGLYEPRHPLAIDL
jgi:hypothetical protein